MTIVGAIGTDFETLVPVYWSSPTASSPSRLNLPGGIGITRGRAAGINNQGTIVGAVSSADADNSTQPVYWASTASNPNLLPKLVSATEGQAVGINNQGTIVGYNTLDDNDVPVYWSSTAASSPIRLPLLPGDIEGQASDINNQGTIVGYYTAANGNNTPVYWSSIAATAPSALLRLAGATRGEALGINNQGNIVGTNTVGNGIVPVYWSSVTSTPSQLLLLPGATQSIARDINNQGNIVGYMLVGNGIVPVYWSSAASPPIQMSILPGDSWGLAIGINDGPGQTAISNICFPAGTPINTDQGIIAIEKIDSHKHTLNRQPIQHITQTTTLDPYLICFEKDAVRRNIPNKRTIMTKDHLVAFEGQLVPAYRFLKYSKQVKKVDYHGEMLYNVLLAEHSLMTVNNLECETLHPDNSIAKLYNAGFTAEETNTLIIEMNEALRQKNFSQYKNAVNRIHQ